jgi:hypothetical protein
VGYGRPPAHSRFKPGQCGNPKGRPKGQRNLRTVLEDTLKQRVKVREGDRVRTLTKLDSFILNVVNKSIQGDAKSQNTLVILMRSVGTLAELPVASRHEPVTTHDTELVLDFLRRHTPNAGDANSSDDTTDHENTVQPKKEPKR